MKSSLAKVWVEALRSRFSQGEAMTPLVFQALREMLEELAAKHGESRVDLAVKKAMVEVGFMPTREQIEACLPAIGMKAVAQSDPNCQDCGGNGWKLNEKRRAERCHCWRKASVVA